MMNAIVHKEFGPPQVMKLEKIKVPEITDDEVLVKTYATSVNTTDIIFRNGMKAIFGLARLSTGLLKPKKNILGWDIAGEIVTVGANVTKFKVGDKVYGGSRSGGNAEYSKVNPDNISYMPSSMNFYEAGVMPMCALSALQGLRESEIADGEKVVIYGASGGIGTYAVQIAKSFGAEVTGVASGKNEQLVRDLGVDYFVDYTIDDLTVGEKKYDLIFDTVGKFPHSKWKKALKENGKFVNAGSPYMSITNFMIAQIGNKFRTKKYLSFDTKYSSGDLESIAKLVDEGKIKSIIDKSYRLKEIADAHLYYERGRTAGKVLVKIIDEPIP